MVQLLRLRQCTARESIKFLTQYTTDKLCQDPFLLENTVKQILSWKEIVHLREELQKLSQNKKPIYEQIQLWLPATEEERMAALERGDPVGAPGETVSFGRSEFGKYFRMDKCLSSLDPKELQKRTLCGICGDLPVNPRITDVSVCSSECSSCTDKMLVQSCLLRGLPYEQYTH
jgi:hypothetical protein